VLHIDEAERIPGHGFLWRPLRKQLGTTGFGVNGYTADAGGEVIEDHDELSAGAAGHEELYLVIQGAATFTVDGEETEAPHGTAIFVRPGTKRSARATEDGTIVLVVGGKPGEAWSMSPGESMGGFFGRYRDKDYEGALAILRTALEAHPGNALILYNIACMEALLGNSEAALEPLAESVAAWPKFKQQAADDEDFTALRDDPRFQELVAAEA